MPLARLLALFVALLASQAFAERAPLFDVTDMEGRRYTSGGLSGKIIVLNFWFKDCPPCRAERPALNRVVARYQANPDVVFLAPALDEKEELEKHLRKNPLRYAVIPDSEDLADEYSVSAFPTHVIIGRDGKILKRWSGAIDAFPRLTEVLDAETRPPEATRPGKPVVAHSIDIGALWEPPLLVRPEQPTRGSTVKVYYSPRSLQEPAEARIAWDVHGDSSFTQGVAPMRTQGVLLSYELKLPADATLVHLRVLSREDQRILEYTLPVFDEEGQPVRNAFIQLGACDIPLSDERELEHHPDNPFALLAWQEAQAELPGTSPEVAREQILELLKTARGNGLELLAVTVDALLLARDFKTVPQVLDTLVLIDRDAFLTRRTLSRLLTQAPNEGWRQWSPTLLPWAWKVLAERDDIWSRLAASRSTDGRMDAVAAERICTSWRNAEPDNPFAHDCLARVLEKQGLSREALAESRAAIDAASDGKLLLYRPGGWSHAARDEEELWARHARLSLEVRDTAEVAGAAQP
ncbi:TlpA family protein disulfide reductase [Hyalangium versicolor]|uniref:TlpA family protein disulfide reductase n=1 Tax=Hyalangium versicolor TaxID=2861190 RepID=UPI001CCB7F3D|nr:TlpA disulfide reductase family protein [Hyalangium versicolor]